MRTLLGRVALSLAVVAVISATAGCLVKKPQVASDVKNDKATQGADPTYSGGMNLCAAIRGNGNYIFAHFGALAKIVEEYGKIDAAAGGSSGSVTPFLYESIVMSPALKGYDGDAYNLRLALLLKSLMGYVKTLENSDEGAALKLGATIKAQYEAGGIGAVNPADVQLLDAKLKTLLQDPIYGDLINPTIKDMLADRDTLGFKPTPEGRQYKLSEIQAAVGAIGAFNASDEKILFREGVINFQALIGLFDRIANFYAGRGPVDNPRFKTFVDECGRDHSSPTASDGSRGKNWDQVADMRMLTQPTSCGVYFEELVKDYRRVATSPGFVPAEPRMKDNIGATIPVFLIGSVIVGEPALTALKAAYARYYAGEQPNYELKHFEAVKIGYYMDPKFAGVKAKLEADYPKDEKTTRFLPMNDRPITWAEVLPFTSIEPGLSKVLIEGDRAYAGGWPDLFPVQVLKAAGCANTVYVTRRDPESEFLIGRRPVPEGHEGRKGVAELLGIDATVQRKYFDLTPEAPFSSFLTAIRDAEAVWCTDWNKGTSGDLAGLFQFGYASEITPRSEFFKANTTIPRASGVVGCD